MISAVVAAAKVNVGGQVMAGVLVSRPLGPAFLQNHDVLGQQGQDRCGVA